MSLKSALDEFGGVFKNRLNSSAKASLRWVKVTAIDWNNLTMDAIDSDGLEYFDILLGVDSQAVKPKQETDCLIAIVENDEATSVLLSADEVEEVQITLGETKLLIDQTGYKVEQAKENLQQVLSDFIAEVQKIIVVQGTTPDVQALEDIKTRLRQILK